ncbi:putative cfem domain-containing protein [Botrytis fragariae]|uniref:Putative cfem domain-containing protein n=1 Tax=Botrytis fragariae TaxID=1964551 RepID=A0A8H6EGH0_9HELO|nr:putative cfem domain-containing protein [Botrytis fragariae]KAF5871308.1 putative cfem domain-containing protein [Botrytis fragariae]
MVDTSLQDFALFIVVFSPALALINVCLRVWSRVSLGQFGLDDGLIVLSMILSIAETYAHWQYVIFNFVGLHIWDVPLDHDPVPGLKYNFAVQILYNPILAIVKTSILMFFLRLAGQKTEIKRIIWALLIINNALMVAIFIVVIFQCTPIAYNWQVDIPGGYCIEQGVFYVATAVVALVTDILVLIVPFWIVIGLKMPRRTKIAVIGVFFLGILVTVVGIVRLTMMIIAFFYPPPVDSTRGISFVTSVIEINLAIITASAPALKPVMRRWFPKLFGSSSDGAYNNQNSGPYALQGSSRYERGTRNGAGFKSSRLSNGNGLIRLDDVPDIPDVKDGRIEDLNRIQRETSKGDGDSDEEIMKYDGIIKTTSVGVEYGDGKSDISDSQYARRTSAEIL